MDGGIASLDVLVPIVDAVKGKLTVGFDSGIRNGADMSAVSDDRMASFAG